MKRRPTRGGARARATTVRPSDTTLREQLRAANLKVTNGRVAVLRELSRLEAPVSHGELVSRLHDEELDRVTVWRILVALTEAGLVDRTDLGDRTWRFELRNTSMGHDPHPHFTCVACKNVMCLPRDSVQITPRVGRGVTEVHLKGRCERCL
jgi:Fur family ferric uptake transcriptional regulator